MFDEVIAVPVLWLTWYVLLPLLVAYLISRNIKKKHDYLRMVDDVRDDRATFLHIKLLCLPLYISAFALVHALLPMSIIYLDSFAGVLYLFFGGWSGFGGLISCICVPMIIISTMVLRLEPGGPLEARMWRMNELFFLMLRKILRIINDQRIIQFLKARQKSLYKEPVRSYNQNIAKIVLVLASFALIFDLMVWIA